MTDIQAARLELPAELTHTQDLMRWASFEVSTEAHLELAGQAVKEIDGRLKAIKAKQTEIFGPLKKAIREFEVRVRDVTAPLETVSRTLRDRIQKFWDARQRKLEEDALAERARRMEEEQKKRDAAATLAVVTGDDDAAEEAVRRDANVRRMEETPVDVRQTVRTSTFTMAQAKVWTWKVVDIAKVPREYLVIDEKRLNAIAKRFGDERVDVPGVEFTLTSRAVLR